MYEKIRTYMVRQKYMYGAVHVSEQSESYQVGTLLLEHNRAGRSSRHPTQVFVRNKFRVMG